MKAIQVFNIAMSLIGYNDINGEISGESELKKNAIPKMQMIYQELYRAEGHTDELPVLLSLNDEIQLSNDTVRDIMPYGVAMLISQSEGDADNQSLMSVLYNQKKGRLTRIDLNNSARNDVFGGDD